MHASCHESEDEERGSLEEASCSPCPGEAEELSFPEVGLHGVDKSAFGEHLHRCVPVLATVEDEDLCRAIDEGGIESLYPLNGLRHAHGGDDEQCACLQSAYGRKHKSYDAVEHEHLATEERPIETAKTEQEEHSPTETQTEVFATPGGIAVHDIEAEAEEEGEDGVCLAAHHKPQSVPHHLVDKLQEWRGWRHLVVEIEMLDAVEHKNHCHGNAADGVNDFDAWLFLKFSHCIMFFS